MVFVPCNARYTVRAVRTRSSSVIDRNLSLTSLPPGAKILPGAHHHHGLDLRAFSSSALQRSFRPGPVSGRSVEIPLPACSMIIEAASGIIAWSLAPPRYTEKFHVPGGTRALFTRSIKTSKTEFSLVIGSGCRRCSPPSVIDELVLVELYRDCLTLSGGRMKERWEKL